MRVFSPAAISGYNYMVIAALVKTVQKVGGEPRGPIHGLEKGKKVHAYFPVSFDFIKH